MGPDLDEVRPFLLYFNFLDNAGESEANYTLR